MKPRTSTAGRILSGAAIAFAVACLIVSLEFSSRYFGFFVGRQAVLWAANGVVLALLLRTERSRWPSILAGTILGSLLSQVPNHSAIGLQLTNAFGNMLAPLTVALFLPRYRNLESWFKERHLLYRFCGLALFVAPVLSSLLRASYIPLVLHQPGFWLNFHQRAIADMLGYALLTPLTLLLSGIASSRNLNARSIAIRLLLMTVVLTATLLVFQESSYGLAFTLAFTIALVALHMGFGASVLALNLIAVIATDRTMAGHGPFVLGDGTALGPRILLLQAFLTLSMITIFAVSVTQAEREWYQSRLQVAYSNMEELAHLDPLTAIRNRRGFEKTLATEWNRALRSKEPIAVLIVDADYFKAYNDQYGHLAGDTCLQRLAATLAGLAQRSTDVVARYGGEEFILLLPNTDLEGALVLAERARKGVESLHKQQDSALKQAVTVSIGCAARVPELGSSPHELINAADRALYRCKQLGRNRVDADSDIPANATADRS